MVVLPGAGPRPSGSRALHLFLLAAWGVIAFLVGTWTKMPPLSAGQTCISRPGQRDPALLRAPAPSAADAEPPTCSIYVLDAAADLGLTRCDLSVPSAWPFPALNMTMEGIPRAEPYEAQHAVAHWVRRAIDCTGARAETAEAADLVFVDLQCYASWRSGRRAYEKAGHAVPEGVPDPSELMVRAMDAVTASPRWNTSRGEDYVLAPFFPGFSGAVLRSISPCGEVQPFLLAAEHVQFCKGNRAAAQRGVGALIPHVAVSDLELGAPEQKRNIFIFMHGACAALHTGPAQWSAGKLLRSYLVQALQGGKSPDVDAFCACSICPQSLTHAVTMDRMRRTVFCPVLAGDTQSSRRLAESVLAGCIPVFVGPPFHTLSMPLDFDYAASSVFIDVQDRPWVLRGPGARPQHAPEVLDGWFLDAAQTPDTILRAPHLGAVEAMLRAIPAHAVADMQASLAHQKYMLYYDAPPGERCSRLGRRIVSRLCNYAGMLKKRREFAAPRDPGST